MQICNTNITIAIFIVSMKSAVSSKVVNYYLACNGSCVASPYHDMYSNTSVVLNSVPEQEEVVRSYASSKQSSLLVGEKSILFSVLLKLGVMKLYHRTIISSAL